jgi:sporulation protein YlmC with PRC-barrel domain
VTLVLIVAALLSAAPALASATTSFTELVGTEVRDARGDRLGEIKDVLFDARDGAIVALTVDYGRWLRISEYEAAFAPRLFAHGGNGLQLGVAEATLRRTPAVGRPAWPLLRASDLVGREVRDRLHRDSGEMVDLVLDLEAERVESALIDLRDDWEARAVVRRVSLEQLSLPHEVGQYPTLTVTRERCC